MCTGHMSKVFGWYDKVPKKPAHICIEQAKTDKVPKKPAHICIEPAKTDNEWGYSMRLKDFLMKIAG